MRRTLVLALAALALLGVVPDVWAQATAPVVAAPTPTFRISGLIDQVMTYTSNMSSYDLNLARTADKQFYGRTRGRFDFIGEVGKARGVLGIEIDAYYGQTGFTDSNITAGCLTAATGSVTCGSQGTGASSSFDLNTDVQGNIEVKWLYTEFEVPLIPVPTVARLGAQPFGAAANYKLATYANGDFAGVNLVSTITPNVRLLGTYVQVEERLTGKGAATPNFLTITGANQPQQRGDDFAVIVSAEVTPLKGLDIKPMYSYFWATGQTSGSARSNRGGWATGAGGPFAPFGVAGNDGVGTGIGETRHTVGLDARWRFAGFSLDPTVLYQFGTRDAYNTISPAYGIVCNTTGDPATNCLKHEAHRNAWLVDVRGGYQLGPLLLQAMFMYTTGNRAEDTLFRNINFYEPLNTDTSYMADWGTQITSLGIDYYQILTTGPTNMGVAIGYDKYGRKQLGAKASYALTPALTFGAGWTILWTDKAVDTDAAVINGSLLPSFVSRTTGASARPEGDHTLIGNEVNVGMTWRFAPGLALDIAGGYLFAGPALGHRFVSLPYCSPGQTTGCAPPNDKDGEVRDVIIGTARVRFTF